ncbi:hypothetical protein J8I87_11890 [Paraburkholderia sp. LEh10]|uniref:hypothetical protein n=1 Tax=Paraburkholderia sp. LEh10 TaxID=2821353 RepID=UPI001AE50FA1|nr:hypothetical protein [Paraburkholderia sp. LEh10]MBP0590402.1 hypothetical protein [Paraburkholderia sp. LEh10]
MQVGQRSIAKRLPLKQGHSKRLSCELGLISLVDRTASIITDQHPPHLVPAWPASKEQSPEETNAICIAMRGRRDNSEPTEATNERIALQRSNTGTRLPWTNGGETSRVLLQINTHPRDVHVGNALSWNQAIEGPQNNPCVARSLLTRDTANVILG